MLACKFIQEASFDEKQAAEVREIVRQIIGFGKNITALPQGFFKVGWVRAFAANFRELSD
jgi:hypothetical protein